MSSASASPASSPLPQTPSPAPELPPKSPSKSPSKPRSPKKSSEEKEEAKRVKAEEKAEEKAEKWRRAQIAKIQKVIEKQENKAKDLCEKLSAAWDPFGVSANQIRLLEAKVVSTPEELLQQNEAYETGPKMMDEFLRWVHSEFGVPEEASGESNEMEVDPIVNDAREPPKSPRPELEADDDNGEDDDE